MKADEHCVCRRRLAFFFLYPMLAQRMVARTEPCPAEYADHIQKLVHVMIPPQWVLRMVVTLEYAPERMRYSHLEITPESPVPKVVLSFKECVHNRTKNPREARLETQLKLSKTEPDMVMYLRPSTRTTADHNISSSIGGR